MTVRLHSHVTQEVSAVCVCVWVRVRQQNGCVWGGTGPQSCALLEPLPLLPPILSRLRCSDPDHNVGGWCYRKPGTPGKIELLHGDRPVFTSSFSGCLRGETEGGQKVGEEQKRRKKNAGSGQVSSCLTITSSYDKLTWQPAEKDEALVNLSVNLHTHQVENLHDKGSQQVEQQDVHFLVVIQTYSIKPHMVLLKMCALQNKSLALCRSI